MHGHFRSLLTCLIILLSGSLVQAQQRLTCAIRNVSVIPMNREEVLLNQTVIIENGIITKIAETDKIKINKKLTIIDGTGKFLIPTICVL